MVAQTAKLPNVRRLFIPDPGMALVEADLARAESQVVAWESGDPDLKYVFQSGIDIHTENAVFTYGPVTGEKHTDFYRRDRLKRCVYAIQNGGREAKIAELLGSPILGQKFYRYWTGRFPRIHQWHARLEMDVRLRHLLENVWGYKFHWFDRTDGNVLGEAIPWVTQSTIAITINHGLLNLDDLGFQILYQVHDSLLLQVPLRDLSAALPIIQRALSIHIPYPNDPLIIPVTIGWSDKSWGDLIPWRQEDGKSA